MWNCYSAYLAAYTMVDCLLHMHSILGGVNKFMNINLTFAQTFLERTWPGYILMNANFDNK